MAYSIGVQNFIQIGRAQQIYDVILIFKMAAIKSEITSGFGFSDGTRLVMSKICLHTKISIRCLSPRLSYYNFRSLKTDVHHIRILLPVLILTY